MLVLKYHYSMEQGSNEMKMVLELQRLGSYSERVPSVHCYRNQILYHKGLDNQTVCNQDPEI